MFSQLDRKRALLVCERTGDWATHLRRALAQQDVRLCETRSLLECEEQLSASPNSYLFLSLDVGSVADVVDFVVAWSDRFPRCRFIAGVSREQAAYEPLLREAGVVHVVTSPRDLSALAMIFQKHTAAILQCESTRRE